MRKFDIMLRLIYVNIIVCDVTSFYRQVTIFAPFFSFLPIFFLKHNWSNSLLKRDVNCNFPFQNFIKLICLDINWKILTALVLFLQNHPKDSDAQRGNFLGFFFSPILINDVIIVSLWYNYSKTIIKQITGETIGEVRAVEDMHQRKAEMARHSDCFIALPGLLS